MFGLTRLGTEIIAGLVLALSVLGLYIWGQEGHQKALSEAARAQVIATQRDEVKASLEAVNRALLRAQEVTIARQVVADKQHKADLARVQKLNDEISSHPEWANAPVPDGVWDAIFKSDDSVQGGAGPAASPATGAVPDPSGAQGAQ